MNEAVVGGADLAAGTRPQVSRRGTCKCVSGGWGFAATGSLGVDVSGSCDVAVESVSACEDRGGGDEREFRGHRVTILGGARRTVHRRAAGNSSELGPRAER